MNGCPICEKGKLKKGIIEEYMFGIYLGKFPADVCTGCNESFTDANTTKKIEESVRKKKINNKINVQQIKTKELWDNKEDGVWEN